MRAAECDLKRLNMGDQIAHAETTANVWPDGRNLIYHIPAGAEGSIGANDGRILSAYPIEAGGSGKSIYHTMAEVSD